MTSIPAQQHCGVLFDQTDALRQFEIRTKTAPQ